MVVAIAGITAAVAWAVVAALGWVWVVAAVVAVGVAGAVAVAVALAVALAVARVFPPFPCAPVLALLPISFVQIKQLMGQVEDEGGALPSISEIG